MNGMDIGKYLPLTEATFYIMIALVEPLHGYGVMQKVERMSGGMVKIGPGTLYGVFDTLQKTGLIMMVKEEDRRKSYRLTRNGKNVLAAQIERLNTMVENGRDVLKYLE